jgi:hypothetical protein
MSMAREMGGHLYMQTNETHNSIVHYRWSASGTLAEVERVPTGGAWFRTTKARHEGHIKAGGVGKDELR